MPTRTTAQPASSARRQTSLFDVGSPKRKTKPPAPRKKVIVPKPIPKPPGKKTWLSASGVETMRRCPRCFWLQYNLNIRQPEGIVSRLANRFDGVIKRYFNVYRGTGALPPMIQGQVKGQLESPFKEKYFATINSKFGFVGKLDECLVQPNGTFTPVDHKTASSDPTQRELIPAYQFQLDSYAFLLEKNGKPPSGVGHLIYFYPAEGQKLHDGFPMQVTVKTLDTHPAQVPAALAIAIQVLSGPFPASAPACPFCAYVETVKSFS